MKEVCQLRAAALSNGLLKLFAGMFHNTAVEKR